MSFFLNRIGNNCFFDEMRFEVHWMNEFALQRCHFNEFFGKLYQNATSLIFGSNNSDEVKNQKIIKIRHFLCVWYS